LNVTDKEGSVTTVNAVRGWKRPFRDPINLPGEDAGNYITKLPKAEHMAPEWQDVMQILMVVAARGWPTMLARIGVMWALRRHDVREFTDRKQDALGQRWLKRDG
jgi:hypothetical protein